MPPPGVDRALEERECSVRHDLRGVDLPAHAQPVAPGTGPVGAVEGERARRDLRHRDVAVDAGQAPAVQPLRMALDRGQHGIAAQEHGPFQAGQEPLLAARPDHQPVHQGFDPVVAARVEGAGSSRLRARPSMRTRFRPWARRPRQLLPEGPLAAARHGGPQRDHRAPGVAEQAVRHLLDPLGRDRLLAARAMRLPQGGEKDPQVVVDLGDRPHRGPRMAERGALLDGDGRGQPRHRLHLRLLHLVQELARVGGEALHVAPLPLRVEGVEGEAALAGAGRAGDHHQPVPGEVAVHSLQVVDPRPADRDRLVPLGGFNRALVKRAFYQRAAGPAARLAPGAGAVILLRLGPPAYQEE